MSRPDRPYLTCHALRVKQGGQHAVYLFALRAEQVAEIASIARLSRGIQRRQR